MATPFRDTERCASHFQKWVFSLEWILQVLFILIFPILIFLARLSVSPPVLLLLLPRKGRACWHLQREGAGAMLPYPGGLTRSRVWQRLVCGSQAGCAFLGSLSWAAHIAQSVFIDGNAQSRLHWILQRLHPMALSYSDFILHSLQFWRRAFLFLLLFCCCCVFFF